MTDDELADLPLTTGLSKTRKAQWILFPVAHADLRPGAVHDHCGDLVHLVMLFGPPFPVLIRLRLVGDGSVDSQAYMTRPRARAIAAAPFVHCAAAMPQQYECPLGMLAHLEHAMQRPDGESVAARIESELRARLKSALGHPVETHFVDVPAVPTLEDMWSTFVDCAAESISELDAWLEARGQKGEGIPPVVRALPVVCVAAMRTLYALHGKVPEVGAAVELAVRFLRAHFPAVKRVGDELFLTMRAVHANMSRAN